ncbi:hypothetical protein JCM21900_003844 [Sporobolomyces salmonicolor]
MEEALGWLVAAGFCYAAYKLVFGSSSSSGGARRSVPQASIDQLQSMFPHVSSRAARWELERNGGSVERAVERALREGGLPEPPASYFAPSPTEDFTAAARAATPTPATPNRATQAQGNGTSGPPPKVPPPSLLKRMGLQAKVGEGDDKGKGMGKEEAEEGWASSKEEREERLKRRKEKLVLAARRKLLEKERFKEAQSPAAKP